MTKIDLLLLMYRLDPDNPRKFVRVANGAAFASREAAEEFKIKAELLYEQKVEIRKKFDNFIRKGLSESEAAKKASDGKMTVQEIADSIEFGCDEWEIDAVQFFP